MHVRINKTNAERVRVLAEQENRSFSNTVNTLIALALKTHKRSSGQRTTKNKPQ